MANLNANLVHNFQMYKRVNTNILGKHYWSITVSSTEFSIQQSYVFSRQQFLSILSPNKSKNHYCKTKSAMRGMWSDGVVELGQGPKVPANWFIFGKLRRRISRIPFSETFIVGAEFGKIDCWNNLQISVLILKFFVHFELMISSN